jgi:translation initiation factor IF-3
MKVDVIGQISQIGDLQVFGENGFKKQEVIIKTVEEYSQFYVIEFTQQKIELLQDLEVGQNVKVTCGLNGREYTNPDNGKYNVFMSLRAWEVTNI